MITINTHNLLKCHRDNCSVKITKIIWIWRYIGEVKTKITTMIALYHRMLDLTWTRWIARRPIILADHMKGQCSLSARFRLHCESIIFCLSTGVSEIHTDFVVRRMFTNTHWTWVVRTSVVFSNLLFRCCHTSANSRNYGCLFNLIVHITCVAQISS